MLISIPGAMGQIERVVAVTLPISNFPVMLPLPLLMYYIAEMNKHSHRRCYR
jgi:hypothetical protein